MTHSVFKDKENYYATSYKIKLYPSDSQKEFIKRCIDTSRYLYNWAIDREKEQYEKYKKGEAEYSFISVFTLEKMYTELKKEKTFLNEVPRMSVTSVFDRVEFAFKQYMNKKCRYPRYKCKRNKETYSYETRCDRMFFEDNLLRIEGLPKGEFIYTRTHTGLHKHSDVKFYSPVIQLDHTGTYWLTYTVFEPKNKTYFEDNNIPKLNQIVGIDLNQKKRFVLSTGKIYYAPNISHELDKLNRLQRVCMKDTSRLRAQEINNPEVEYSNRAKKRRIRLNKQFKRIHNIGENFVQTVTKEIINMNPDAIVMEDLEITPMKKNHLVASAIQFSNFYRAREVMQYKCNRYGIPFILADKTFKSSQICSSCGYEQKIGRNYRYICPECGANIDRDVNAAINLANFGYSKLDA